MSRDALRTRQTEDGRKVAVWQLVARIPRVVRAQLPAEHFTAYRLPSQTPLHGAQPGTIMFDAYPDLADAREMLPQHEDLWDVLRDDYWTALLCTTNIPDPLGT
ncbi:hypothetical protein ACLMAL_33525 [Nocardia sp. CWNU-33]|uniref:hypothetical protein n=1 Tax=Nocardia sp. CWNU-33 TaxID=3392117 RepID=UPI00398E362D